MMALTPTRLRGNLQVNEEREEGKKGEKDAAAFASPNRQKYGVHTPLSVQSIKDRGAKMKGVIENTGNSAVHCCAFLAPCKH